MAIKMPSDEEVDAATAAFEPYFSAVGKVVHAWNHLQEELGRLFCILANVDNSIGSAIWHSLTSDKAQRDLLKGVLALLNRDDEWIERFPKATEGIKWVTEEANRIGDRRNNAIHAPCSIIVGDERDFEIIAVSFFGHPRAKNLRGKDILQEFAWYEQSADALKQHVREIQFALGDQRRPWPDKPLMPTQGQKSTRRDWPRRSRRE